MAKSQRISIGNYRNSIKTSASGKKYKPITGDEELDLALHSLKDDIRRKYMSIAMNQSNAVIREEARKNASQISYPRVATLLPRAITSTVDKKSKWMISGRTFVNTKKPPRGGDSKPYWAIFFEVGTEERVVKKLKTIYGTTMHNVPSGSVSGNHFMRRAYNEKWEEAVDVWKYVLQQLMHLHDTSKRKDRQFIKARRVKVKGTNVRASLVGVKKPKGKK
mgnify:FL=1